MILRWCIALSSGIRLGSVVGPVGDSKELFVDPRRNLKDRRTR